MAADPREQRDAWAAHITWQHLRIFEGVRALRGDANATELNGLAKVSARIAIEELSRALRPLDDALEAGMPESDLEATLERVRPSIKGLADRQRSLLERLAQLSGGG